MKRIRALFFALLLCFSLSACDNNSAETNSKAQVKETHTEPKHTEKQTGNRTLEKIGDSLYDSHTGTVTLNSLKDISNKKLTIGDLNLKFIDAKVITVTDISDSFKEDLEQCFGVRPKEFTYAQIRYKTQNTGKEDISWRGFRKAVTSEGQQVDLDFNLNLGIPNPSSIDMMPNSKLEENMVWVPVNKGEKNIRLKGEDVLKKDNSKKDFIVYGKEIKIDL